MGADVLILHAKTEETLINDLFDELDIIGIVANADVVISSQIQKQLAEALDSNAMAVLLVTEGLLQDLEQTRYCLI
jgi:hypothetical protein